MTKNTNKISGALEDYLEVILYLEKNQKVARVKDIADRMGILRGSVTSGLKSLSEKGLVNYEPYKFITLTPKGEKIAKEITRRHYTIKDFLKTVLLKRRHFCPSCHQKRVVEYGEWLLTNVLKDVPYKLVSPKFL